MNISFVEKKENYAKIAVSVEKADYQAEESARLKQAAQKASVPGFRKGHVPAGMIKKMYGEGIHVDTVQDFISKNLYEFIEKEKLATIGQPFVATDSNQEEQFLKDDVNITFSVALTPEIKDSISTNDSLKLYKVTVPETEVDKTFERALEDYSTLTEVDTVEDKMAMIYGSIHELDGDLPKEDGVSVDNAIVMPEFIKNEDERAKFMSSAKNSVVVFSPFEAFNGDKAEIASLLHIEKDDVEKYENTEFSFEINRISVRQKAEMNQEFFDRFFGKDEVKSEEEARAKILEAYSANTANEASYKFAQDFADFVRENKLDQIELEEDIIFDWFANFAQKTPKEEQDEAFKEDFKKMLKSLKLDLFMNDLARKYELRVDENDVKTAAQQYVANQFARMGWSNPTPEVVERQAESLLSNADNRYGIERDLLTQMIARTLRDKNDITVVEEEIALEDFQKLIAPAQEAAETGDETEVEE